MNDWEPDLRRVYWETTAGCNLRCIHCRRVDVMDSVSREDLSTEEARSLLSDLRSLGRPVLILSGGEPLFRKDIFELARYAKILGLPVALSTNGTLVDEQTACRIKDAGIYYASVSLDGANPATHEGFRGKGSFEKALLGLELLRAAGLKVQINFTVTRQNVHELTEMYRLACSLHVVALYLFLLVPVGCGVQIAESQMLSAPEVEEWLKWVCERAHERQGPNLPEVRAICAPHYYRVKQQLYPDPLSSDGNGHYPVKDHPRLGCLAGVHMCFISHKGDVFPCGYLPLSAGSVREQPFHEIWECSPLLGSFRKADLLTGRCGACEFKEVCGGCRARAFYAYGSVYAEEPNCAYLPPG